MRLLVNYKGPFECNALRAQSSCKSFHCRIFSHNPFYQRLVHHWVWNPTLHLLGNWGSSIPRHTQVQSLGGRSGSSSPSRSNHHLLECPSISAWSKDISWIKGIGTKRSALPLFGICIQLPSLNFFSQLQRPVPFLNRLGSGESWCTHGRTET